VVFGRRYRWESQIANDGSLIFSSRIVSLVRQHCVSCIKVEIGCCVRITSVRNKQKKSIFIHSNNMFKFSEIFITDKITIAITTDAENTNHI